MTRSKAVSVVIAAKDSLHLLRQFLPPILEQLDSVGPDSELLVFDDGSTDGTGDALAQEFPAVRVWQSEQNIGYVRARNRAFQMARHEIIVSLDSDIQIQDRFLEAVLERFDCSDIFAVACRSLNLSEERKNETLSTGYFDRGLFRLKQPALVGELLSTAPGPVFHAPGGISAFRKSVFLELQGFDELFYPGYGGEDIDYSYRARKRGYRLAYAPEATALHLHRQTMKHAYTERAVSNIYQRNLLWFTWKNISDRGMLVRHGAGLIRMLRNPRQIGILWAAVRRVPSVLARRRAESAHWTQNDYDLLAGVMTDGQPSVLTEATSGRAFIEKEGIR